MTIQIPLLFLISFIVCTCWQQPLSAHCQVPCGIYGDHARVQAILEDAQTVLKACRCMDDLSGKSDTQARQQFVRWVNNKESHAQKIIETISDYFLTQRVKPTQADYAERLIAHHTVLLSAMKAKQSASVERSEELFKAVQALLVYYPSE